MRKIISIGSIVLVITSVFVVLNVVFVEKACAGETNPPYEVVPGLWQTDGDWEITSPTSVTHTNKTIIVNGNLIIGNGASLTLRNVTLLMNCSHNGEFNITVEEGPGGGTLIIEDFDRNPSTDDDASIITSFTSDGNHRFGFVVGGPDANFEMRNSELHECGWDALEQDFSDAGLNIQAQNPIIHGNDISNNYRGINLYGLSATGASIIGNSIHDNEASGIYVINVTNLPSSQVTISDNDIYGQAVGVFLDNTAYVNFDDSTGVNNIFNHNNYGIYSNTVANLNILNNNFNNNNNTIHVNLGSNIYIENNTILGNLSAPGGMGIYMQGNFGGWVAHNTISEVGQYDLIWGQPRGIWLALGTNDTAVYNNEIYNVQDGVGIMLTSASTGAGNNVTTNYIHDNDQGFGILAWGHDCAVYNNQVERNEYGIYIYGDTSSGYNPTYNLLVSENYVSDNIGTGSQSDYGGITTFSGYDYGDVHDITFIHNQIIDNNQTLSDAIGGHHIFWADAITIIDEEITNNDYNLWADNSNVTIINSTLTKASATYDIYLDNNAQVKTINTTFDKNSIGYSDGTDSELTVQWYLHVKARDGGLGVDGAEVYINDIFGDPAPSTGQPFTTANGGWVNWTVVTEFVEVQTSRTYYTPHHIEAKTSTKHGWAEPYIDRSMVVIIDFNTKTTVLRLEPEGGAPGSVNRTYTITIESNADDAEDVEANLTPHFEYRINDTSPWMNETNPYFVPGSKTYDGSKWVIQFQPPAVAPIDTYDFRVRFNDTYPSFSDWYYAYDSVNVLNCIPVVEYADNTSSNVLRGNSANIIVDGNDIENGDDQNFTNAEFEYRAPGDIWDDTYLTSEFKDGSNWRSTFTPEASPLKAIPGEYDFRFRFQDNDGEWSQWYYIYDWIEVSNNPPYVEDLKSGYDDVYRGQSIWIFANGSDLEDGGDGCTVTFWYDKPGGPSQQWENMYLSDLQWDASGFWKILFTSPYTEENLGLYKFMVNFTDDDGDSHELVVAGLVNVINNPPTALAVEASGYGVRAGSGTPIYILVDADDDEDPDNLLKVFALADDIQYQQAGTGTWVSSSTWFGASSYVSGQINVPFQPDDTAPPGDYYIRVRVTDEDGDKSDYIQMSQAITVYPPNPDMPDVTPQAFDVYRTETIWIHIDAHDDLEPEPDLTPHIEYDPPGVQDWSDAYFGTPEYIDTNANLSDDIGYWRVPFTPDENAPIGNFEFRAWITTSTGGISEMQYDISLVEVKNNVPEAIDLRIEGLNQVNRGDSIYIYADSIDVEDSEEDLTPTFWWRLGGGSWESSYFSDIGYGYTASNSWRVTFTPSPNADIGSYDFRVRFRDIDDDSSIFLEELNLIEVLNGLLTVDNITVPSSSYRLETIFISANGSDPSGSEADLTATFQYKEPTGDWISQGDQGSYLSGAPEYTDGYWRIAFNPPADAGLGQYSFRVQFSNTTDTSDWMEKLDSFTLMNIAPEIDDLTVPSSGYRMEAIYITANGTDADGSEHALIPSFQYKGPNDTDWVSQEDTGGYLVGTPQYIDGYWRIEFSTPTDAELGQYSFRVQFSDDTQTSQWMTELDSLTLNNNLPTVQITAPLQGEQTTYSILFMAIASDIEDSTLTFEWDFGDGSSLSNEKSPTHNFTLNRTFIITVTVRDSDGGSAKNNITIIIPKEIIQEKPGPKEDKPEFNIISLLLLLIIIVLVILLLLLWLYKKRQDREDVPKEELPPEVKPHEEIPPEEAPLSPQDEVQEPEMSKGIEGDEVEV